MTRERVVYDCNVFLQALLSSRGPAFGCIELARAGEVEVFASPYVLAELRRTPHHPDLKRFSHLTVESVELFIANLLPKMHVVSDVPEVFVGCRDPKDNHYISLAIATDSKFVVSRDNDLRDLMDPANPEAREFLQHYPRIRILEPGAFLREIELSRTVDAPLPELPESQPKRGRDREIEP